MGLGEVTFTREHIETLRALMVVGWALLFLWWAFQLGLDARADRAKTGPQAKAPPKNYCPLHRVAREDCEPKHHESEP